MQGHGWFRCRSFNLACRCSGLFQLSPFKEWSSYTSIIYWVSSESYLQFIDLAVLKTSEKAFKRETESSFLSDDLDGAWNKKSPSKVSKKRMERATASRRSPTNNSKPFKISHRRTTTKGSFCLKLPIFSQQFNCQFWLKFASQILYKLYSISITF